MSINDKSPDWSPDGTKIAFSGAHEIFVMNADGSEQTRLTNTPNQEMTPTWSPDGTKIAFENRDDIYVMDADDGGNRINLSNNPAIDVFPDWGTAEIEENTTPPVLTVPEDIVVNATTANGGTEVTYNVTAEDNVDGTATLEEDGSTITQDDIGGNITISCDPASGSEFSIGETEVQCIAIDEAGNEGTSSFTVTVNPLPPSPPDPLTAEIRSNATQGDAPATFRFNAIVTGGTEPYTYNWDFGDGSSEVSQQQTVIHTYEEAGVYTVTLIVTDAGEEEQEQQQEATDTLQIIVSERPSPPPPPPTPTSPREAIERLQSYIENLQDVPESAKTRIDSVLERALAFLSDNNTRNDASACNMFGAFISQVGAGERRGSITEDQAEYMTMQAEDIRDMIGC